MPGVVAYRCVGIRSTVPRGCRDRWLTEEEIRAVLDVFPEQPDQKDADSDCRMECADARPSEAAGVRAEDLVTIGGERVWQLRGTKMDRDFLVPLVGPVGEILNRRYLEVGGKGPLFWKASAQRIYPAALQKANEELRTLSGLADFRPHDFRRTARTHFSALGVSEAVAEALLNHAKGEIEATYNLYTYWAERKAALALWHGKLAGLQAQGAAAA